MVSLEPEVDNDVPETGRLPALLLLSTTGFQSLILYISPSYLFVSRKFITFSSPLVLWNFTVMCFSMGYFEGALVLSKTVSSHSGNMFYCLFANAFPSTFSLFCFESTNHLIHIFKIDPLSYLSSSFYFFVFPGNILDFTPWVFGFFLNNVFIF